MCAVWLISPPPTYAQQDAGQRPLPPEPVQQQAADDPAKESGPAPLPPPEKSMDLWSRSKLTGDWGSTRTRLEEAGIRVKVDLMNQVMVNMYGGQETENGHDTAGSYELDFYFDLEKLFSIRGATFWIRGKGTWGGDDSDFDREKVGGFFKTNQDADIEEPIFVDKWHWQQFLFDKKIELRFGRQEPVKDLFDTSKVIGHEDHYFMNRALVRNATIPSNKGLAAYANWAVTDDLYVRAAVFDAQARDRQTNFNTAFHDEDWFRVYLEAGLTPEFDSQNGELWGHYRAGAWYDPTKKRQFLDTSGGARDQRFESGDCGFYFGFDQKIWKENGEPKDDQGLAVAGRWGVASGEVNTIEQFWAAAVQYIGILPDRDRDTIGVGIGQGILSDESRRVDPRADRETVYELYYSIVISPWLTISPDFQYITNTGGDKDDPDTAVAGIRVRMNL